MSRCPSCLSATNFSNSPRAHEEFRGVGNSRAELGSQPAPHMVGSSLWEAVPTASERIEPANSPLRRDSSSRRTASSSRSLRPRVEARSQICKARCLPCPLEERSRVARIRLAAVLAPPVEPLGRPPGSPCLMTFAGGAPPNPLTDNRHSSPKGYLYNYFSMYCASCYHN